MSGSLNMLPFLSCHVPNCGGRYKVVKADGEHRCLIAMCMWDGCSGWA